MRTSILALSLGLLVGLLASGASAQIFRDVPRGHWAEADVEWLNQEGLIEGWDGKFHGKKGFSRYEMAKFMARWARQSKAQITKLEARIQELEAEDDRLHERIDDLFDSKPQKRTSKRLQEFVAAARRDREGSALQVQAEGNVQERLGTIHQRIEKFRTEGIDSPLLVVPPGSHAFVTLPKILLGDKGARFIEGVHILQYGAEVRVPAGSTASVVYPGSRGGFLLLERSQGRLLSSGMKLLSGSAESIPGDEGRWPLLQ